MAPKKKVTGLIKLQIQAGAANPAPPIGPALGQHGVNIMEFCKAYNAATESQRGNVIPVEITVYEDRSFTFITKTPPAAELIKKAAGVPKGSATPHTVKVASLTQAQEDLKAAQEALVKARDAAGPQIPLGEVAFLRHLPAVVDTIGVSVGAEVGTGTITLASGDVAAVAKLAKAQTSQLETGDAATLITPDGTRIQGSVTDVTTLSPEEGQVEGAVQVTITPETPLDAGLRGTTIRVNIATSTSEQETLKVPEAAVTTGADSKSRVRVKETSGSYRDVEVTVGESGDGMVGVTAVDGQLAEGDSVVVGILR